MVVTAEIEFQVHHCLMSLPSSPLQSIKTVISHPQALAQCEDYIRNLGLKAEKQYDTAGSAKMIAEQQLHDTAAIASSLAAEVYGLQILASHVEDDENNFTRFLLIAPTSSSAATSILVPTASSASASVSASVSASTASFMKTSIVFALRDEPGVLFKALSVFALRDIHLSKIESRPGKKLKQLMSVASNEVRLEHCYTQQPSQHQNGATSAGHAGGGPASSPFKYLFYLDLLAHADETRAQNALGHLREIAPFLRVLGSYPAATAATPTHHR